MWKQRDTRLVDVYKGQFLRDNSTEILSNDSSTHTLSQHYPTHPTILTSTSNSSSDIEPDTLIDANSQRGGNIACSVYGGNEFDVFGKEQHEEHFAPLYSMQQFTPTNKISNNVKKETYRRGEVLLRTQQEFKRGQIENMLEKNSTIKSSRKRKAAEFLNETTTTRPDDVLATNKSMFIKSTAAANTPIASIFIPDSHHSSSFTYIID